MSDFVQRHLSEKIGDFAGRRRYIDAEDIAWVMARKRQGLPDQHIATMGGMCLADVQRIRSEHMAGVPLVSHARPSFDPTSLQRPVVRYERRYVLPENPQPVQISLTVRLTGVPSRFGHALGAIQPMRKSMKELASEVAARYGLMLADLTGPSRSPKYAVPRQEAMWVLKQEGRWSYPQIGAFFGGRDHTTAMHGVRAHEGRLLEAAASEEPRLKAVA